MPTCEAFNFHTSEDLGDTKLIKSFIRPQDYSFEYFNPHHFKMNNERYVDAHEKSFEWYGGAAKPIVWDTACVNHYICRSMEHYLMRIKRRLGADQHDSTDSWKHFDRNDIYKQENPFHIKKANNILHEIKKECVKTYTHQITRKNFKQENKPEISSLFLLKTYHETTLDIDQLESFLCNFDTNEKFIPIYGVIYNSNPNRIYPFYNYNDSLSNIPLFIREYNRYVSSYPFLIEPVQKFRLYNPKIYYN